MDAKCFGSCPFACSSHIAYSPKADDGKQPTFPILIPVLILSPSLTWKSGQKTTVLAKNK